MSTLTTVSEFHTIVRCLVLITFAMFCCSESDIAALNESGRSVVPTDSILIIPDHSQSIQYNCRSIRRFFGSFFLATCDKQLQLVVIMTWDQPTFCIFRGVVTKSGQCPLFSVFLVTLFKHKVVQNIIGWLQPSVGSAIKDLSSAPAAIAHFLSIYEWSRIRAKGHSTFVESSLDLDDVHGTMDICWKKLRFIWRNIHYMRGGSTGIWILDF